MVVNQWVPAAHRGDAVGDSARRVRAMLRRMGHESELYAITIDDDLRDAVRPFDDPASRRADVTILHFAVPSAMTEAFAGVGGVRVLQYHNITPAHFLAPYDAHLADLARRGRHELAELAGTVHLALGDSEYNRAELERLGFGQTGVLPIAVDTRRITLAPPRPALEDALDDGLDNILFVGRIAPNKRIEDHVRLAALYHRLVSPDSRFVFVGRMDIVPGYHAAVRALIDQCGLPGDRFLFTGAVPDEDLATYYRMASVYLSLSEHEGFCVPLVEAMAADVPILAYAAAAVPDTLGGAGVQFAPKDLEQAAELLGLLVHDDELRAAVVDGQRRRLADFGEDRIERDLAAVVERVIR
jgi:L-malate glycosyltransferase